MSMAIRALVECLGGKKFELFDRADGRIALAGIGQGLDLFAGERVLAAGTNRDEMRGNVSELHVTITDLRTCIVDWSNVRGGKPTRFSVLHGDLVSIDYKHKLSTWVEFRTAQAVEKVGLAGLAKPMGPFYEQLCRVHPAQRQPEPAVGNEFVDPVVAMDRRWRSDDHDTMAVLGLLASEPEHLPAHFRNDFVTRAVIDHRVRSDGPGMADGTWLCAVPALDLAQCFTTLFGPPMQVTPAADGQTTTYDFALSGGRKGGGGVASLGVGMAAAGFGLSTPLRSALSATMHRKPLTSLQVTMGDGPHFSKYQLFAGSQFLGQWDARLAASVHRAVAEVAHEVLMRRLNQGWRVPFPTLMG